MSKYINSFKNTDNYSISSVGGKGANLIELSQIKEINVPDGFCITTEAYAKVINNNDEFIMLVEQLNQVEDSDTISIRQICRKIRSVIEGVEIPSDIKEEIKQHLNSFGEKKAFAVRSSATAEDLPSASFAGQHDTYLNIIGEDSLLYHIRKCWASLYTDRAVIYRIQNGFEHSKVSLAVIVQEMILPQTSGIMFTADPNTSNRKVLSIDASYGLGEASVSGIVSSDNYSVRDGKIINKKISKKDVAIHPLRDGGTIERDVDENLKATQALSDNQILELERIGRRIEDHYAYPQDIEWCYSENNLYIVQSRPITTLYPLPKVSSGENRIFMSSGHLQMMTAPMKPLGIYFFRSVTSNPPSQEIGGRLYLDVTNDLASPLGRIMIKSVIGMIGDTLLTDSVTKIIRNKDYIKKLHKGKDKVFKPENEGGVLSVIVKALRIYRENNPEIIKGFINDEQKSIDKMKREIEKLSGDELFEFIYQDHEGRRKKMMQPENAGAMTAVMLSIKWFDKKIEKWIGIKNAADTIIQSVPNSVTGDTGLALLDVADVVRKYPEVVEYFNRANDNTFFEDISRLDGGKDVCESIKSYLDNYGMRCSGDIDITVPRWSERPTALIPLILNNIKNFEPNSRQMIFEQGVLDSEKRIQDFVNLLENKFRGKRKAKKIRKVASIIRNYIGYREYPKFSYMKRYFIYKQALLKEGSKLINEGIIKELDDIYFLYFEELREVVKTRKLDYNLITTRKEEYKFYEKLTPQRVITSDGDVIKGEYNKSDFPEGALIGVAVSSGVIEGRARVISRMEEADFEEGDILITTFTDPSWTPIFVSIKGLVTEVGGVITHGSIIAREYGLPAVVSVENATKLIKDGQMIRVNGTEGYVEILS